ncbi:MAG: Asp23/Gls24 family envelope stress response protein [Candidatus Aquicultorales bacterium]
MAPKNKPVLGEIHISDEVIAEIAGRSTLECYGVVGMGSPGLSGAVSNILTPESRKGVRVQRDGDKVAVVLHIIVEYGTNLAEVAHNLMTQVKYAVEHLTGIEVDSVEVNVQNVKVSR